MVQTDAIRGNTEQPDVLLSGEDIRAQLKRIEASPDFSAPERVHKFLCYVVEEALEGRAERIKAYSIAIEVFGRDASFDAQSDPAVRIEASRLRRALERYYLMAGHSDPLLITIPKGGYAPLFTPRDKPIEPPLSEQVSVESAAAVATASQPAVTSPELSHPRPFPRWGWIGLGAMAATAAIAIGFPRFVLNKAEDDHALLTVNAGDATPGVPRLLVEPFDDLTGTESSAVLARGLTEEVIGQIAKFKDIVVVESTGAAIQDVELPGYKHADKPRYALVGSVQVAGDTLRMSARLLSRADGSVLWANRYDQKLRVGAVLDIESDIAASITTALAQPYGIVFQADAARVNASPPDDWDAYNCTLYYYSYQADLGPQTHASAQTCLQRAVERFPAYATAWALLSLTYIDEYRFKYRLNSSKAPPLDLALDAARRAVSLDNQNVRALEAEMAALFLKGDIAAALEVGARAMAVNPNDAELLAEYGNRLGLSGQWKRGGDLIAQALTRNRGPVGYYESVLALCLYMQGQYGPAAGWIRNANLQSNPLYHLIAAAIFGQVGGATSDAHREREWMEANASTFLSNIHHEVEVRIVRPEDRAHFIDGLRRAGFQIPD